MKNRLPIMTPQLPSSPRAATTAGFPEAFLASVFPPIQMEASAGPLLCTLLGLLQSHSLGRVPWAPAPSFTYAVPWTRIWDVSGLWFLQVGLQLMELGVLSLPRWLEGKFLGAAVPL